MPLRGLEEYIRDHTNQDYRESIHSKRSWNGRDFFDSCMKKYRSLLEDQKLSTGDRTAILCSGSDGSGVISLRESQESLRVGRGYARRIDGKSLLLVDATSDDLREVLDNRNIRNVIVIGHASYSSWVATDGSVSFLDVSEMTTHLKQGFFAKLGCDLHCFSVKTFVYSFPIPFGYFVVNDRRKIYQGKAYTTSQVVGTMPKDWVSVYDNGKNLEEELRKPRHLFRDFSKRFLGLSNPPSTNF
ncbi:hypothetical protein HY448_00940 [Candidatus Pacearchaeota archaeon]|nr:hypothetical protein [Candidatus Pacearchaeota archaeon]